MYTEDDYETNVYSNYSEDESYGEDEYEYEEKETFNWKLLLKIILVVLGIIVLIILLKNILGNKTKNNGEVYNNNVDKIRLASEEYFFNQKHLPEDYNEFNAITLKELKDGSFITEEIIDYKNNACSDTSTSKLTKTNTAYELVINLQCNEENKLTTFYYDLETYNCLSCSGNSIVKPRDPSEPEEPVNPEEPTIPVDDELDVEVSCTDWSKWTTKKVDSTYYDRKQRTVFKIVKNNKPEYEYSEWTEWKKDPITKTDNNEVETKEETEITESEQLTTTDYSTVNQPGVTVIDSTTHGGDKICTTKDVKKTVTERNTKMSDSEYAAKVRAGVKITKHNIYVEAGRTYHDVSYQVTKTEKQTSCSYSSSYTVYTYTIKQENKVTYYRERTLTEKHIEDLDTNKYYETVPAGYTKVIGSEITQYSYKINKCK